MAQRLPSSPPTIPGFSPLRVLGSGGFADVFLYEQNMPRRQVAVKVLVPEVATSRVREMFHAEVNLMAQLSAHPSILTVYEAGVATDGRPYIVMEYCSDAIGRTFRTEPLAVLQVLRMGIKVASAVETAHRTGVFHRDIKPSNILQTAYGQPVLSDFGIATTVGESTNSDVVGFSVPWSAPEVVNDETTGTVASEIWSLAATLYSLLAGRSPFEIPRGDNSSAALVARIQRGRPQPIGRPDVPARLEYVMKRGMSRLPQARQKSVLELIRELQSVECELGLPQTPIDVAVNGWAQSATVDEQDRTRVAPIVTVNPHQRRRTPRRQKTGSPSMMLARSDSREPVHDIYGTNPVHRWRLVTVSVVAIGLLIGLGVSSVSLMGHVTSSEIPVVANINGVVHGSSATFTWKDPGIKQGDNYQVRTSDGAMSIQKGRQFELDSLGDPLCIIVAVNRSGKMGPLSAEKCIDIEALE